MMIHKVLTLPLLILIGSFVMAEDKPQSLFDFTGTEAYKDWQSVNDGVMGGVSEGKFNITDTQTLEFYGTMNLRQNPVGGSETSENSGLFRTSRGF
jgi:hypothetical protein